VWHEIEGGPRPGTLSAAVGFWPAEQRHRWTPSEPDDDADKVFEDHPELRDYEEP
jgi:hypothetical protein